MQAANTRHAMDHRAGAAAFLAAIIFAAGIALGSFIDLSVPSVGGAVSVPVGDRSYEAAEKTRANGGLSVPVGDRSYEAAEKTRANGFD